MTRFATRLAVPTAVLATCVALVACGGDDGGSDNEGDSGEAVAQTPKVEAKVAEAEKEGRLTLLLNGDFFNQELGAQLVAGFEDYYDADIAVEWAVGPGGRDIGGQVAQTDQADKPAPTDVTFVPIAGVPGEIQEDRVDPIDWSWAPNVADNGVIELDGAALRVGTFLQGFTYNTNMLAAEDVPATLEAVLDVSEEVPIATTPYASGFGPQFTDAMWGLERTFDWAREFAPMVDGLVECGQLERVASGEFALQVYDCGIAEAIRLREEGAPVDYKIPTDVPYFSYFYLMVPPNAAHPAAAHLWINWLLSPEAQAILWEEGQVDLHTLEGSQSAGIVEQVTSERELLEVDVKFYEANLDTFTESEAIEDIFARSGGN